MLIAGKVAVIAATSRLQALSKCFSRPYCRPNHIQTVPVPVPPHDVFISHRGPDTRRNLSGLLYDHLLRLGHRPFLDYRNMKAGDKLSEKIDTAIRDCKVGVVVFSPRFCESSYCLHELTLLIDYKKRVIPIFYNVKPSQLRVGDIYNGTCVSDQKELEIRFSRALEEAKNIVGLDFNSSKGYWSEFLQSASDAIIEQISQSS
ncbi:protein VARIATION IN COMPOUND TRIGGERED ROOT growth response-like [Juglans regia]|uniref:Protein VARIATION IN COMPOUND TRIGGERED ROOT growth response-like n=1 Tax=Juglans regia TaxID=51240 RepID=A0A6P9DX07_JUGRE|nr:protein VARIATION IN COMPOUND TRIGGERED ROOT growth response-like [Juglans regia]